MNDEAYIKKWIKKVIDLYYVNSIVEQDNYEFQMIQLLTELVDLVADYDEQTFNDMEVHRNHLMYYGLHNGDYDVLQILGSVAEVMIESK